MIFIVVWIIFSRWLIFMISVIFFSGRFIWLSIMVSIIKLMLGIFVVLIEVSVVVRIIIR